MFLASISSIDNQVFAVIRFSYFIDTKWVEKGVNITKIIWSKAL